MRHVLPYLAGGLLCAAALVPVFVLPLSDVAGYGTVWLASATVLIWVFTLGYGFLSRWYDDEVGIHLLVFCSAISFVFANLLYLRLAAGATAAPAGLRLVTGFYVALTFIFTWRDLIFIRAQTKARRELKENR